MRILIIGEFSSFSKNLSTGFRALGHECFVFSWGDGFKKIDEDGAHYSVCYKIEEVRHFFSYKRLINRYNYYCSSIKLRKFVNSLKSKEKWDVVLVINPVFLKRNPFDIFFSQRMIFSLVGSKENIFLSACGGDVPFYDYWSVKKWKNWELINYKKKDALSDKSIRHFKRCASFINKVIPVAYDYAEAWRKSKYAKSFRVYPTIPLPVDPSGFNVINEINGRIVVFHGITRPEEKGTSYIIKAMDRLHEKYPEKVECVAKGGLPLKEYLSLMDRANIVIDQTFSVGGGMNALYALSKGKVLLGGNEPENANEYGTDSDSIPIINILPDSDQIFNQLERLILNPKEIMRLSLLGRTYVEMVHDSRKIASMYIDIFQN